MSAAYSRFAKAGPPIGAGTCPRRVPRWASVIAIASAVAIATAALVATAGEAQTPVPPAGSVAIVVMQSDGLTLLPVGSAVIPPLACDPGGTR